MILFTVALTAVGFENLAQNIIWTILLIVPIGIIILEVIREKEASSTGRMIATFTLIAIAAPMSYSLNHGRAEVGGIELPFILFDLIMLAGPLGISLMLTKKGLNEESLSRSADFATLFGLLILGLFDTSGGLLFIPLYLLVISRAMKHRMNVIMCIAPISLILFGAEIDGDRFVSDGAVVGQMLSWMDIISYNPAEITILDLSRFSFILMAGTSLAILAKGVLDRQHPSTVNGLDETPMTVPAFWLALGMFGVIPEASWLLLAMTILLGMYAWLTGRMEIIPWVPVASLLSFMIGFEGDSNFNHFDGLDYLTHSLLGTGIISLIINQASAKGWLYKWADQAIDDQNSIGTVFDLTSVQGREKLTSQMRIWTIVGLTFSWTAFKGIGTMIGAIWVTYDTFINGQKYAILAMPLLHAFAVWNILDQFNQDSLIQDILVGTVLMLSGILMTMLATKTEFAWNLNVFDWLDEIEYYGWIDRVGQLAIAYFLVGITWAIGEAELEAMLWAIWAIFLSGVAIQGFRDETETPWRRGIGSMGCIFSLFMLSWEFNDDLFTYVTWMFMGVVALGFGFAYIARMGEVSTIFSEEYTEIKDAIVESMNDESEDIVIPAPVTEEESVEEEEEFEEEEPEEDSEDIEEEVDDDELLEVLEEVSTTMPLLEKEIKEAISPPEPVLAPIPVHYNYDLQLDPSVLNAIQNSLATTPHEGFQPVVSIAPNGNLKIDFKEL